MRINLTYSFINYQIGKQFAMFQQEDRKYFVIETPINPDMANSGNVWEHKDLTKEQAVEIMLYGVK